MPHSVSKDSGGAKFTSANTTNDGLAIRPKDVLDRKELTAENILADFIWAFASWRRTKEAEEQDFEFALGEQWENEDVQSLKRAGVKALVINKIKPMIQLITGIERQSRSDFQAFPEGAEDSIPAEIATRLLKNIVKVSNLDFKLSDAFEDGVTGGEGWLEPYIDYTYDLLNGVMKFRKLSPFQVFPDPDFQEYDASDGRFMIKFQQDLSKEQLADLFPDKLKEIKELTFGKINDSQLVNVIGTEQHIQSIDYPSFDDVEKIFDTTNKRGFDLISYYYKKQVAKYLVADKIAGRIVEAKDKAEADAYVEKHGVDGSARVIKKMIPQIWLAELVGNKILSNEMAWTYPRWKGYPFIPFFAHRLTTPIKKRELMIQGIVRSLKDPQVEHNKRRTQELRHLNSTANSGWLAPKGSLTGKDKARALHFGSASGLFLEYDATVGKPERIFPMPLSQGHAQLAEENAQDMKEISGINSDLLVTDDSQASGRAILLRQRQGLVMIQSMLDNYAFTKRTLGRFLLSQLGEVFTIETATKIVGDDFIRQTFSQPVHKVVDKIKQKLAEGQEISEKETEIFQNFEEASEDRPATNQQGELEMELDNDLVGQVFNQVLNDAEMGTFDVAIGEGPFNETVKMSNYLMLLDLAEKGIPIPPQILISESTLSEGHKEKIASAIEKAQQAAAQQAQAQAQQTQQTPL